MMSGRTGTATPDDGNGATPSDWKAVTLGDLVTDFISGGTPSTKERSYWQGSVPWMRSAWISNRYVTRGEKYITPEAIENSTTNVVPEENLLIATRVSMGNVAINKLPIAISQDLTGVVVNKGKVELEFLYWKMKASEHAIKRLVQGSTIKGILREDLERLRLSVPSRLSEQRRIAEVLSTADDAAVKTDEIIAETERLKNGLIQRLLTRGIGHTKSKKTAGGEIPEEWEVVKLADVVESHTNGFASGVRATDGVVQLRMNNVTTDGRVVLDSYLKVPPPQNLEEYLLQAGDLVFNNTNSIDLVGKSAIFPGAPFPCTFSNHFTRLRIGRSRALSAWILWQLVRLWGRGFFRSIAIRHVGQAAVRTDELLSVEMPLPPLSEQRKIVAALSEVDDKLRSERARRTLYEELNRGLMQQLLTGKLRVKV